jgi:hypothetical protein
MAAAREETEVDAPSMAEEENKGTGEVRRKSSHTLAGPMSQYHPPWIAGADGPPAARQVLRQVCVG